MTTRMKAAVLGLAASLSVLATGCTVDEAVARTALPGTRVEASVKDVVERGSYIDAFVDGGGFQFRLFFPRSDVCRGLLAREEGLHFTWLGLYGRIGDGENRCDAVGVLSLVRWRDRQPRRSREPLPRAPARYQEVYRDKDLVQLHGRFPLASQLGFRGTGRLVAVIPNDESCAGFAETGTASMEFRVRGPRPLTLINGDQLCVVQGLAQPPPQNPPRDPQTQP